ncbi:ABC transporter substrate-binding protein [Cellulosilyticum lentocellum]|uniref:Extracellular solute-binding protein family 1 n=1 Tax=Cellulosilyticum lentocellum (strain ATCC 49066 / DSM 5427 / NCIMB 11756 / RHM5) TaxID=642492 RepID=F2JI18_CELLD|nr:ABC transporter substrate-binding protein [Cellulosilyticum lentocellum]ADZ81962.1 extracellular solute-binding protein family 1 [Cellulosilyticum lentocellum DSM 5427]
MSKSKLKRWSVLLLCGSMALGVGCSKSNESSDKQAKPNATTQSATETENKTETKTEASDPVKISFLNSKGEIQEQLETMATTFTAENPNITVEVIPCAAGQSPFEMLTTLYAANNAPALAMLDPADVSAFKENLGDLSQEKWVNDTMPGALDSLKADDKIIGFPFAVEGWGLIYNKNVLDEANVDPTTINTTAKLEEAFQKIEANGKSGVIITPADWSLGAHLFTTAFSDQSSNTSDIKKVLEELSTNKANIKDNVVVNGLLDTFDVMKKYNYAKADPLSAAYETNPKQLGEGEVGFWFMGNWAWANIKEFAGDNTNFGFIPVPISNNEADYGNTQLPVATTKAIVLDASQNSIEQQNAAKVFLDWIVYQENGQKGLVQECSIIPAFTNISIEINDPLGKSIQQYIKDGKTSNGVMLSNKHWADVGAAMQKYLGNYSEREELFSTISEYWASGDYK